MQALKRKLRTRQALGKYRIRGHIARGGFADVYRASDTIEGVNVALKIPHAQLLTPEIFKDILQEVRLAARLNHPNILRVKNADHINDHFVIAYRLGTGTLAGRMTQRLPVRNVVDYMQQMLAGVAYAHEKRVLHCDIKPENFILFDDGTVKLTDFGISKIARRTIEASGSGTVGYIAPEQALGRPSFRSDVFSLGLIFYEMFTKKLPQWPFEWPPPEYPTSQAQGASGLHRPDPARLGRRRPQALQQRRGHACGIRKGGQTCEQGGPRGQEDTTPCSARLRPLAPGEIPGFQAPIRKGAGGHPRLWQVRRSHLGTDVHLSVVWPQSGSIQGKNQPACPV